MYPARLVPGYPRVSQDFNAIENVWKLLRDRLFETLPKTFEKREAFVARLKEAVKGLNREEILDWGPRGGETGLKFRQRVRKLSTPINPSILSEYLTVISPQW